MSSLKNKVIFQRDEGKGSNQKRPPSEVWIIPGTTLYANLISQINDANTKINLISQIKKTNGEGTIYSQNRTNTKQQNYV